MRISGRARQRWLDIAVMLLSCLFMHGATAPTVSAAKVAQAASDPRWIHHTHDKDGLLSNNVWSIDISSHELWFGTDIGVAQFDGTWSAYVAADTAINDELGHRVPAGVVHALEVSSDGAQIWAATDTGCIAEWSNGSWRSLMQFNSPIYDLLRVGETLWIGTTDGVYLLESDRPELLDAIGRQPVYAFARQGNTIWIGAANGLWRNAQGIWSHISADNEFFASGVYALEATADGLLVVGTPFGLAWRQQGRSEWQYHEVLDEMNRVALVQSLALDNDGNIWAGTDGAGAVEVRPGDADPIYHGFTGDANLVTRFVRDVAVDMDGAIWMATPVGVFQYQKQLWHHDVQGEGVENPRNYVNDLLLDREGMLWVATGGGGVRKKYGKYGREEVFTTEDGVPSTVLMLAEDAEGGIWAGSFWGVVRHTAGQWSSVIEPDDLPDEIVTSLLPDQNSMWIGTEGGIAVYDLDTATLMHDPAFAGISVEALAHDSIGRLWVGTTSDGIWLRQSDGRWRQFRHVPLDAESLPGNQIVGSGLVADPFVEGGMWALVLREGLAHWNGRAWAALENEGTVPSNLLWTLHTAPGSGTLWIGSEAGFSRYDGLTWETFDATDGLQSSVVYAIAGDDRSGYWIGGRTGLSYYDPDDSPPWIRVESVTGQHHVEASGLLQVNTADEIMLNLAVGDVQTAPERLKILYRMGNGNELSQWQELARRSLPVLLTEEGTHNVEFLVRDLSFNYSPVYVQEIIATKPPPTVAVPWLGIIGREVFHTLLFLGTIAILGASYVTVEIIQEHRRAMDAVRRGYNPYISGEPVRSNDMFFGRHELLQRIVDTLHNNSIMIHGERRIGKTTLLYQLATALREVDDADFWFVPIYVDLEGTPQAAFFHYLIEEIAEGVARLENLTLYAGLQQEDLSYPNIAADAYSDRDFNRDLRRLIDVLVAYGELEQPNRQVRLILLLDEMDVLSQYDRLIQQQLRRTFMRDFATTLGAVVAGIQISKDWDRVESPWYNLFNEIALEPFSHKQGVALLIEPVRGMYLYDSAAIEFILEQSGGRPYKIQQYGLEAVNHMLANGRRRITFEDAVAAHEIIANGTNGIDPTHIGLDDERVKSSTLTWRLFGSGRERNRQS